jgi:hypothetical protein
MKMKIIVAKEFTIIADNVCSIEIYDKRSVCIFMNSEEEFVVEFNLKSNADECHRKLRKFFIGDVAGCYQEREIFDIEKQNGFLGICSTY